MNTIRLYSDRRIKGDINEINYTGDNNIATIRIFLPDNIDGFPTHECTIELRAVLPSGDYIAYSIPTNEEYYDYKVTTDITDKSQTVQLLMRITHGSDVIGRTNTVPCNVKVSADGGEELTPREQFDTVIREQRETITAQSQTINSQASQIEQDTETISGLNTQVGELTAQNTNLSNQNKTYRETIQTFIDNPPAPKLQQLDPINPQSTQQTINPESPNVGFPQVIVNGVSAESVGFNKDYYKEGEQCLGQTGTYNPFPYNSVGGIYITEVDEDGYPVKILVKDYKHPASAFPIFFDKSTNAVRALEEVVFENCPNILTFPNNYFQDLTYLKKCVLPEKLTSVGNYLFYNCTNLKTVTIPNSLSYIGMWMFQSCPNLEYVTIESGFNCNSLNLSSSALYSHDTILSWFNALADKTGETAYTLTIGATNLAKMTAEEIAIATNKNWNLA